MDDKRYITLPELMDYLRISRTTAYKLVKNDSFPCIRIGAKYLIDTERLHEWLNAETKKNR